MVTREDLESYIMRMDLEYQEVDPGMFLVQGRNSGLPMVVHHADALLLIRMKVMDLPAANGRSADLNRRLLELNATDLVHGSYGISSGSYVLTEALELEHLDYEEFQSSYESMTLALATHLRELSTFKEER